MRTPRRRHGRRRQSRRLGVPRARGLPVAARPHEPNDPAGSPGYRSRDTHRDQVLDRPIGEAVGDGTPNSPRLVVEIWLAVATADGPRALMLRRSKRRGGFWQGVSGRVETGDGTLRRAAEREIAEELGLHVPLMLHDLGGWTDFVGPMSGRAFRKRSFGTLLGPGVRPETLTLSREHVEARLVSFDEARALVAWEENRMRISALEAIVCGRDA